MSLKETLLKSGGLRREAVDCHEWGQVTVRELTAAERDAHQSSQIAVDDAGNSRLAPRLDSARLACWGVIDPETGQQVFSDDDLPELRRQPGRILDKVSEAVLRLSGFGKSEKNSETTPTSSPSTT